MLHFLPKCECKFDFVGTRIGNKVDFDRWRNEKPRRCVTLLRRSLYTISIKHTVFPCGFEKIFPLHTETIKCYKQRFELSAHALSPDTCSLPRTGKISVCSSSIFSVINKNKIRGAFSHLSPFL